MNMSNEIGTSISPLLLDSATMCMLMIENEEPLDMTKKTLDEEEEEEEYFRNCRLVSPTPLIIDDSTFDSTLDYTTMKAENEIVIPDEIDFSVSQLPTAMTDDWTLENNFLVYNKKIYGGSKSRMSVKTGTKTRHVSAHKIPDGRYVVLEDKKSRGRYGLQRNLIVDYEVPTKIWLPFKCVLPSAPLEGKILVKSSEKTRHKAPRFGTNYFLSIL